MSEPVPELPGEAAPVAWIADYDLLAFVELGATRAIVAGEKELAFTEGLVPQSDYLALRQAAEARIAELVFWKADSERQTVLLHKAREDAKFWEDRENKALLRAEAADRDVAAGRAKLANANAILDILRKRAEAAEAEIRRLSEEIREKDAALRSIGKRARSDGQRTFDDCIRDLGWIDDECRLLCREA